MKKNKIKVLLGITCIIIFVVLSIIMFLNMNFVAKDEGVNVIGENIDIESDENENDIFSYVMNGELDNIIKDLESGTDINIINVMNNQNLLHYAIGANQTEIAKYLIENGIDKDVCDNYGNTPIMLAVYGGNEEIFELLKDDVNCNVLDAEGNTLLHLAAASGNINVYTQLSDSGLDVNIKNNNGYESLYYAQNCEMLFLIMEKMKIEKLDKEMSQKLFFSAISPDIVDYIIDELDVDINFSDEDGNNALYYAISNGVEDVFEELINKGINIDNRNNEGNTVLHYCASDNLVEFTRLLLNANVDISIENNEGLTAHELADMYQSSDVIELLGGN